MSVTSQKKRRKKPRMMKKRRVLLIERDRRWKRIRLVFGTRSKLTGMIRLLDKLEKMWWILILWKKNCWIALIWRNIDRPQICREICYTTFSCSGSRISKQANCLFEVLKRITSLLIINQFSNFKGEKLSWSSLKRVASLRWDKVQALG